MHIDLPDNLLRIGEKAFAGCRIESLKLPLTVVDIDSDAFVNCSKLEILQLNEGLEHIGENAFKGCGFSKVIIPSSVINIGGGAFDHEVTLCCYSGTKGVEYARLHNYKLEKA